MHLHVQEFTSLYLLVYSCNLKSNFVVDLDSVRYPFIFSTISEYIFNTLNIKNVIAVFNIQLYVCTISVM